MNRRTGKPGTGGDNLSDPEPLMMTREQMAQFNADTIKRIAEETEAKAAYAEADFWKQYEAYVQESLPRHTRAMAMLLGGVLTRGGEVLSGQWLPNRILDLGCGQTMEGYLFARDGHYIGVDKDRIKNPMGCNTLQLDYFYELPQLIALLQARQFEPTTILSLFSIEPHHPSPATIYERLLGALPSVQRIISSGFYYLGKEDQHSVKEGEMTVYQTTPDTLMLTPNLDNMTETRLTIPAPSTMFGPDVIEVWRLIERRP